MKIINQQARNNKQFSFFHGRKSIDQKRKLGRSVETLIGSKKRNNLITIRKPRQILSIEELLKENKESAQGASPIGAVLGKRHNLLAERNEVLDLSFKRTDCTSIKLFTSEEDVSDSNTTIASIIKRKLHCKATKPKHNKTAEDSGKALDELKTQGINNKDLNITAVNDVMESNVKLKEEVKKLIKYIESQGEELFHLQCENANQKNRLHILTKQEHSRLERHNLVEEINKLKKEKLDLEQRVQSLELVSTKTQYKGVPGTDDLEPIKTILRQTRECFSQQRKGGIILFSSKFRRKKANHSANSYAGRNLKLPNTSWMYDIEGDSKSSYRSYGHVNEKTRIGKKQFKSIELKKLKNIYKTLDQSQDQLTNSLPDVYEKLMKKKFRIGKLHYINTNFP